MNREFELFHGAALCRVVHHGKLKSIQTYSSKSNSAYIVNDEVGLYIKYSLKRMSPWRFTFLKSHQEEILEMNELLKGGVFLTLVCRDDGIACLSFTEIKQVLGHTHEEAKWLAVSRKSREKYTVAGSDGKLKRKMADSQFPEKLFSSIMTERETIAC